MQQGHSSALQDTVSLTRAHKFETRKSFLFNYIFPIFFKILRSKRHHRNVRLNSFDLHGHSLGFYSRPHSIKRGSTLRWRINVDNMNDTRLPFRLCFTYLYLEKPSLEVYPLRPRISEEWTFAHQLLSITPSTAIFVSVNVIKNELPQPCWIGGPVQALTTALAFFKQSITSLLGRTRSVARPVIVVLNTCFDLNG